MHQLTMTAPHSGAALSLRWQKPSQFGTSAEATSMAMGASLGVIGPPESDFPRSSRALVRFRGKVDRLSIWPDLMGSDMAAAPAT